MYIPQGQSVGQTATSDNNITGKKHALEQQPTYKCITLNYFFLKAHLYHSEWYHPDPYYLILQCNGYFLLMSNFCGGDRFATIRIAEYIPIFKEVKT